tara:strand:- start:3117 stop:4493 length:1377 start_codon:yes stop_codon:yes gene_type:complete
MAPILNLLEQPQVKKGIAVCVFIVVMVVIMNIFAEPTTTQKHEADMNPANFAPIFDDDFTLKNNQSALQSQQLTLEQQQRKLDAVLKRLDEQQKSLDAQKDLLDERMKRFQSRTEKQLEFFEENTVRHIKAQKNIQPAVDKQFKNTETPFGYNLPPRVAGADKGSMQTQPMSVMPFKQGIQTFDFDFATNSESKSDKRTIHNYVPSGSFVTAVVTGGADANAGVNGQGDTAPVVFRTINKGFLPNGKKSRIKDCVVTGSIYGEVSSSRGIVRTNRMSCIFKDGSILDVPVKGTVFNYGRNGIRGTTIMKNGKIVTMAGVSGLLGGLGEAASAASKTQSVSPLGTTSTVKSGDILKSMLGSGLESASSKLSDYYIKLAQQYHPIVEINPGAIVNIVFLEGFPLDSEKAIAYEQSQQVTPSSAAQMVQNITNPLLTQLPNNLQADAKKFNQIGQTPLRAN